MHDVVVQKLPVRMILDRAGLVGNDGPTHHGSFDLTYLGTLPKIVIMAPSDEIELMNMIQVHIYMLFFFFFIVYFFFFTLLLSLLFFFLSTAVRTCFFL